MEKEVVNCLRNGVDALWPGCEILLKAPLENLQAMVRAVEKYGSAIVPLIPLALKNL